MGAFPTANRCPVTVAAVCTTSPRWRTMVLSLPPRGQTGADGPGVRDRNAGFTRGERDFAARADEPRSGQGHMVSAGLIMAPKGIKFTDHSRPAFGCSHRSSCPRSIMRCQA